MKKSGMIGAAIMATCLAATPAFAINGNGIGSINDPGGGALTEATYASDITISATSQAGADNVRRADANMLLIDTNNDNVGRASTNTVIDVDNLGRGAISGSG